MEEFGWLLLCWLLMTYIGFVTIPINFKVFKFLPDRGYAFSKPVGLLLLGFLCWLIGFIHFSTFVIVLVLLLLTGFSAWLWVQYQGELMAFFKEKKGTIIIIELFFIALYLLFLFFRMYNPDIIGTEKFMDLAFLNSMTRATSMPPFDPWLAGKEFFISYYYFGYLLMSIMAKLSGTPPAIAFNLSLGLLFALAGLSVFGLIYNLTRKLLVALGGWAAIFMLGNLDGFRQVLVTHSIENFNWWTPSRVIPDTINEFPFFSFLLGDMHPHMLSIPYVIIALALALNHLKSDEPTIVFKAAERWGRWLLWGGVIGALGFMNSWDLPTTFFVALLAIFFQQFRIESRLRAIPWKNLALLSGLLLLAAFIPYLPFYWHFHSQAKGIAWTKQNTQPGDYLLIFGLFTFLVLTFLSARYHQWFTALLSQPDKKSTPQKKTSLACPQCGSLIREGKRICGRCGYALKFEDQKEAGANPLLKPVSEVPEFIRSLWLFLLQPLAFSRQREIRSVALTVFAALVLVVIAIWFKSFFLGLVVILNLAVLILLLTRVDRTETVFALMLLFTAWLLIFGCEVLHIKDTFEAPLDRMNTVFKFYYQAWFLLGVAGVYGAYWTFKYSLRNINLQIVWLVGLVLLVAASLVYPYASVLIKTNHFYNLTTLDGSYYLNNAYAPDREGIEWLRKNISGTPVILEATGAEYTDFARVSAFTGLPTVLGWAGHELQWRGNYDEPGKRIPDIDTLYGSQDIEKTKALIERHHIEYVFVGTLERGKYSNASLNKFALFMDVAHENPGGVVIYKRR